MNRETASVADIGDVNSSASMKGRPRLPNKTAKPTFQITCSAFPMNAGLIRGMEDAAHSCPEVAGSAASTKRTSMP